MQVLFKQHLFQQHQEPTIKTKLWSSAHQSYLTSGLLILLASLLILHASLLIPHSYCNPVSSIPLPRNPVQFNPLTAQLSLDDIPLLANPFLSNASPNSHPIQVPENSVPLPVELIPLPDDPPIA